MRLLLSRRIFLSGLFLASSSLVLSGCLSRGVDFGLSDDTLKPNSIVTSEALSRVNTFRNVHGKSSLRVSKSAGNAALEQAKSMANAQKMAHLIGFGADFGRRLKRSEVSLPAAENIAKGQDTLDRVLLAWEKSASHRKNLLGDDYRGLGVAYAYGQDGEPYWAMILSAE